MEHPTTDAPKSTGKPEQEVTLTGAVFPWKDGQPVIMEIPGSPCRYLPCFQGEEGLRSLLKRWSIEYESIKQIENGKLFLEGLLPHLLSGYLKVILDPWTTDKGRVRYLEIRLPASN